MRVALKLDDRLVEAAKSQTGIEEICVLMDTALKALIAQDAAKPARNKTGHAAGH